MDIPSVIFREYDVRGTVGDQLTPELAHAVGRGLCTIARRRTSATLPRIAVGRDNRPSGTVLARAMADGIAVAGGTAVEVGELPTPALYFSQRYLATDAAVQVTGSHNPPEFNGFKMIVGEDSLYGDGIQDLYRIISTDAMDSGDGGLEGQPGILTEYVEAVVQRNAPIDRAVRVVVDCGNGVASLVAERALSSIGADVIPLYCESDGTFPNHHPDPTVIENLEDLQDAVRRTGAELGIAFDGDGDRVGAVDEHGAVVYGDKLLLLLARDLVRRGFGNSSIIFDVKCSDILRDELAALGLEPVIWKTGHSLIKAKMHETGAPLAGEMSGHMFFGADYFGYDDALFAAARLLGFVAAHPGPLSGHLTGLPQLASTPEIRIDCPDDLKFDIVKKAADYFGRKYEVLTLDGVRMTFPHGWGLLRASNTQPVLVMRFEASTPGELEQYRSEIETWLEQQGVLH